MDEAAIHHHQRLARGRRVRGGVPLRFRLDPRGAARLRRRLRPAALDPVVSQKTGEAKFIDRFPDAIDVVVRGIKAGLPLGDSLRVIAAEALEPIRTEFRLILETQAVGVPLGEACAKLFERIPLPEANFFAIVISIQQKSGGNLSEALSNLSTVLRDRKKMKGKIKAMSTEARVSAAIIGALPVGVMSLIYMSSPDYITVLWTDRLGQMMLAGSAVWMSIGIMVMKKMINFNF
jgi:tight adherence protein B